MRITAVNHIELPLDYNIEKTALLCLYLKMNVSLKWRQAKNNNKAKEDTERISF